MNVERFDGVRLGPDKPDVERLQRARSFIYGNARTVDRARFEVVFENAPADRLIDALSGYRNSDGGFGHALEPDLRTPASQPLHTETGLSILQRCGIRHPAIAKACCEFLGAVARADAALPAFLPGALDYPAAGHWQAGFGAEPSLDRTLGVVALLVWHGATHTWLTHALQHCRAYLTNASITEAHHLLYAMEFASIVLSGDGQRRTMRRLHAALLQAEYYVTDTPVTRYGLTPLHYAPYAGHPAAALFEASLLEDHLDDLLTAQESDGGWPIRFQPPSEGARVEWRGCWTIDALLTLRGYGRLGRGGTDAVG